MKNCLFQHRKDDVMTVAKHIVSILEDRGIKYVFGLPGEENIALVNELDKSEKIEFILVQDERSGAFMAGTLGWLTGEPGVVIATLGPGALNMTLSIADAHTHSFPVIAIAAQGELAARVRETTQVVDLKSVFKPLTKWSEDLVVVESTTEIINKAYNEAMGDRKGATFITIPSSLEQESPVGTSPTVIESPNPEITPTEEAFKKAADSLKKAKKPIILAGLGASRDNISEELNNFANKHHIPVATSFMAKGVIPETAELSLGVIGFFIDDHINIYLEDADLILAIGYDFAEFDPSAINPNRDKTVINLHTYAQETHRNFTVDSQLIGDLKDTINQLSRTLKNHRAKSYENTVRGKINQEFEKGEKDEKTPLKPVQIVNATRRALPKEGKVLVDTGAVKMWMARLFPAYDLNTILINNALSSMSWAIPGAIATKLLYPDIPILTVVGDGSFNMSYSELATAKKYNIPLTILVWDDSGYGLIKWKMEMDLEEYAQVDFDNPDYIKIAEAYGGNGYVVNSRDELEETLKASLEKNEGLDIIVAPVDYEANMELTEDLEK